MEYLLKYKESFNTPIIEKTADTIDELDKILCLAEGCKEISVIRRKKKI
jgi:hypothetical protein